MRRVWQIGLFVPLMAAACSGSPSPTAPTPAACAYSISSTVLNMAGIGGTATLVVATGAGCAWTAASSAAFVSVAPTASQMGPGTVSLSVAENTGDARVATVTIGGQAVTVNQAAGDAMFGNWAGTITKGTGCPATLPAAVAWTGIIRRDAGGAPELVVSIPTVGVVNETVKLQVSGNTLQFSVAFDVLYTFTATLAADRRSLTGTFAGGGCSGTWTGGRQ